MLLADEKSDALANSRYDYISSAAKSIVGAAPFVGSLLVEIAGTIIPNQRLDRIAHFAEELEARISEIERSNAQSSLTDEHFTELVEDAMKEAVSAVSEERRRQIANLVANSLKPDEITFIESKHVLRLLGEINDIEVVWLRLYLHPTMGGDEEFRAKHAEILKPRPKHFGLPESDLAKSTLQESYKEHLVQLGLLGEQFEIDSRTKLPVMDSSGGMKRRAFRITAIGRLLLTQIGFTE